MTVEMMKRKMIDAANESINGVISLGEWGSIIKTGYCDKSNKEFRYWNNISDDEVRNLFRIIQNMGLLDGLVKKIICGHCGFKARPNAFYPGRGRDIGEHPEHTYCPQCGVSIDWYGYKVIREETQGICDECEGYDWYRHGCTGECPYNMQYERRRLEQ